LGRHAAGHRPRCDAAAVFLKKFAAHM
jgi:hypothetical protein